MEQNRGSRKNSSLLGELHEWMYIPFDFLNETHIFRQIPYFSTFFEMLEAFVLMMISLFEPDLFCRGISSSLESSGISSVRKKHCVSKLNRGILDRREVDATTGGALAFFLQYARICFSFF